MRFKFRGVVMVVWITGLAGAGKTEIGTLVYQFLKKKEKNSVFVDGDILRKILGSTGYSRKERMEVAFKISNLCVFLE